MKITQQVLRAVAVASLSGTLLHAQAAAAQEPKAAPANKGDNVQREHRGTSPQTDAVANAAMASQLRAWGDRNKDALAMITAARLLQDSAVREEPRKAETQADKPGTASVTRLAARDDSVAAILARAKEYAKGRADLVALADEVGKSSSRGRAGGPGSTVTSVNARGRDIFNVPFRAGEPARVAISGDGDTDLDLVVYDENGRRICRAAGTSDQEVCSWTPARTATFRIEVINLGSVFNRYRMLTN